MDILWEGISYIFRYVYFGTSYVKSALDKVYLLEGVCTLIVCCSMCIKRHCNQFCYSIIYLLCAVDFDNQKTVKNDDGMKKMESAVSVIIASNESILHITLCE